VDPATLFYLDDLAYGGTAGVPPPETGMPVSYGLSQNYPNPFNPSTKIAFTLERSGQTSLEVYDLLGEKVAALIDGYMTAGTHEVRFDDPTLPSGAYVNELSSGSYHASREMILLNQNEATRDPYFTNRTFRTATSCMPRPLTGATSMR
jgi:hypothetical protein